MVEYGNMSPNPKDYPDCPICNKPLKSEEILIKFHYLHSNSQDAHFKCVCKLAQDSD
jgi:hypothetical protein